MNLLGGAEKWILVVAELSKPKFEERISANAGSDDNDFDDGITLSAYLLYKLKRETGEGAIYCRFKAEFLIFDIDGHTDILMLWQIPPRVEFSILP